MLNTPQTFQYSDLGKIGFLVLLEALLSADNALILAIMVRHLPKLQQKQALFYGLLGAFVLRIAAIGLASIIVGFWWIQAIGALYLIYLPVKHFWKHSQEAEVKAMVGAGFWLTVVYANLADLAFAIDSILAAIAIEPHPNKIWIVITGAIIGIVLLRWAANAFLKLLDRYPALSHVAYLLVGWAGLKLLGLAGHNFHEWMKKAHAAVSVPDLPKMSDPVFWVGMGLIVVVGTIISVRGGAKETQDFDAAPLESNDEEETNVGT